MSMFMQADVTSLEQGVHLESKIKQVTTILR